MLIAIFLMTKKLLISSSMTARLDYERMSFELGVLM